MWALRWGWCGAKVTPSQTVPGIQNGRRLIRAVSFRSLPSGMTTRKLINQQTQLTGGEVLPILVSALSQLLPLSFRSIPSGPELPSTDIKKCRPLWNIWAKIPSFGRAQFSALQLFFLFLVSPVLFAQTSTSDIQKAAAGDAQAQFALADNYFHARYVTLNYAEILIWYRKSAAQGFAPA